MAGRFQWINAYGLFRTITTTGSLQCPSEKWITSGKSTNHLTFLCRHTACTKWTRERTCLPLRPFNSSALAALQLGPTSFYKEARTHILLSATFAYKHSTQQVKSLVFTSDAAWGAHPLTGFMEGFKLTILQLLYNHGHCPVVQMRNHYFHWPITKQLINIPWCSSSWVLQV